MNDVSVTGVRSLIGSKGNFACRLGVTLKLGETIKRGEPSGGAFATKSVAMTMPAPGRGSTTTGWPHESESLFATARATVSPVLPPGANAVTIRTRRDG